MKNFIEKSKDALEALNSNTWDMKFSAFIKTPAKLYIVKLEDSYNAIKGDDYVSDLWYKNIEPLTIPYLKVTTFDDFVNLMDENGDLLFIGLYTDIEIVKSCITSFLVTDSKGRKTIIDIHEEVLLKKLRGPEALVSSKQYYQDIKIETQLVKCFNATGCDIYNLDALSFLGYLVEQPIMYEYTNYYIVKTTYGANIVNTYNSFVCSTFYSEIQYLGAGIFVLLDYKHISIKIIDCYGKIFGITFKKNPPINIFDSVYTDKVTEWSRGFLKPQFSVEGDFSKVYVSIRVGDISFRVNKEGVVLHDEWKED